MEDIGKLLGLGKFSRSNTIKQIYDVESQYMVERKKKTIISAVLEFFPFENKVQPQIQTDSIKNNNYTNDNPLVDSTSRKRSTSKAGKSTGSKRKSKEETGKKSKSKVTKFKPHDSTDANYDEEGHSRSRTPSLKSIDRIKRSKRTKDITPGLEALVGIIQINLENAVPVEQLSHWELNRQFSVTDQSGKKLYHCGENVRWVCDVLCQGYRPFLVHLFDPNGDVVIQIKQRCSCLLCLFHAECAGAKIDVIAVGGKLLGTVSQIYTCCTPSYEILDPEENRIMTIVGKCCRVCIRCPSRPFLVFADVQREEGGEVNTEIVAKVERQKVCFREDMHVEMKCLLLGALFLVEMDYYRSCRGVSKVIVIVMLIIVLILFIRTNYFDIIKEQ